MIVTFTNTFSKGINAFYKYTSPNTGKVVETSIYLEPSKAMQNTFIHDSGWDNFLAHNESLFRRGLISVQFINRKRVDIPEQKLTNKPNRKEKK